MRTRQLVGGIDWSLTYTGEVFGLSSGSAENGAAYEHLIGLEIHSNLSKLLGWTGGSTQVSVYQIDDVSRNAQDLVGAISDPSNIDARAMFSLFTLWAQEERGGHFGSLRIGQIAADDEFLISKTAAALINSAFGITGLIASRPNDVLTFGVGFSNVSREDVALGHTTRRLFGYRNEIRRGNTVFEVNYTATPGRWWIIQPDLQYIFDLSYNTTDPDSPAQDFGDAFLVGLMNTVAF